MSCKSELEWTSFPFVERPLTSTILTFFLILLSILLWKIVYLTWGYPLYYYSGMALVLGSLLPYFVPTRYIMGESNITIFYLFVKVVRQYSDFGCFYTDKRGIMLSTFKTPRRLDPFRGQSLRFSAKQTEKEELSKLLEVKIGKRY